VEGLGKKGDARSISATGTRERNQLIGLSRSRRFISDWKGQLADIGFEFATSVGSVDERGGFFTR
jgi:hypothetical protein